ncbi:MAG: cell envelope integrity protein TolA [Pseudomonadota bacterium]
MRQFFLSLVLHIVLLSLLLFSMNQSQQPPIVNKGEKIIHATAIENTQVKAVEKKIEDQKIQQQQAEAEKQRQAQEKIKQAEEKRVAEQKRVEDEKIAAQKKVEEDKAIALQKAKDDAEKKRLAELEKQKKAEEEKLKKIKDKEEADKLKAQKAVEDAKKLKEQQQKQYEAAAALQKKIAAKQAAIAQQRSEAINGVVDQYKGLILEAIRQTWLVPPGTEPSLATQLVITLGTGGQVTNVQVVKGSGNALLDQSAVAAVYKASPLPVPPDADAAAVFKQFSLTLKPEQIA